MSSSTMSNSSARAHGIASVMRKEAAFENKPNHMRHVENQIKYADAVGEATFEKMKTWIAQELPKMIQAELSKPSNQIKVQARVDQNSLKETKRTISDFLKSIFH